MGTLCYDDGELDKVYWVEATNTIICLKEMLTYNGSDLVYIRT